MDCAPTGVRESESGERTPALAGLAAVEESAAPLVQRALASSLPGVGDAAMRFVFYSHDGLGLGHVRRNLAIAAELVKLAPEASILLVTGIDDARHLGCAPNVEILKLPSLRKVANGHYVARHLRMDDVLAFRARLLAETVASFRPSVLLVDRHPLGAGGELRPCLDDLRRNGGRAVLGLRDILDAPQAIHDECARDDVHRTIVEYYDRILVYGEQRIFDPIREYRFPEPVAHLTRFCGYVVNSALSLKARFGGSRAGESRRRFVLATVGGGEDGFPLIEAFIHAAAAAPWRAAAVAGPMAPKKELPKLRRLARAAGVRFEVFVEDLADCFGSIDALVSQGGYNTVIEAVAKGTPLVCVPRSRPRVEQLLRARAFEELGLLRVVERDALTPERLRTEVDRVLGASRQRLHQRVHGVLDFAGAERAAGHLLEVERTSTRLRVPSPGEVGRALLNPPIRFLAGNSV